MRKIKTALTCIGIILTLNSFCQNIPLGALPMLYNGGFAGEGKNPRFNLGISQTRPQGIILTDNNYNFDANATRTSYFTSYDQFIPKIRSGIGLTLSQNQLHFKYKTESNRKTTNYLLVSISPKFSLNGKYTIAPFVDFSYSDSHYHTSDSFPSESTFKSQWSMNYRLGVLFNSSKFYFGATFYFLNKGSGVDIYPRNYPMVSLNPLILQAGYTFQKSPESKFCFTPQLAFYLFRFNGPVDIKSLDFYRVDRNHRVGNIKSFNFQRLDLSLMFRYKYIIWAINNNGLGLGFQNKRFRVVISQNLFLLDPMIIYNTLSLRYVVK